MGEYANKIETFLRKRNLDFGQWLDTFPLHEQPAVLREFKAYAQQVAIQNGNYKMASDINELDDQVDFFENVIIDELAAKQKVAKAEKDLHKAAEDRRKAYHNLCDKVLEGAMQQDDKLENWLNIAKVIIKNQKEFNAYNENYWKPILHLL